jgi:hypothetical protein
MVAAEEQAKAASHAAQQLLLLQQQRTAKTSGSPRHVPVRPKAVEQKQVIPQQSRAPGSSHSPAGGPAGSSPRSRPLHKGTAATSLRAEATRQAMLEGRFDSREER